jgi:hypothetical protein
MIVVVMSLGGKKNFFMWGSFTDALNSVVSPVSAAYSDLAAKTAALLEDKPPLAAASPPWLCSDVPVEKRSEVEGLVRNLSSHRRTFLEAPPQASSFAASFVFDEARIQTAQLMLELDKELARWRWDLVPSKIREDSFWCNYFYRVELIVDTVRSKPGVTVAAVIADEAVVVAAATPVKPVLSSDLPERRSAISNNVVDLDDFASM